MSYELFRLRERDEDGPAQSGASANHRSTNLDHDHDHDSTSDTTCLISELPHAANAHADADPPPSDRAAVSRALFASHALSALNARLFEFGAVLYLADAFPGSLAPMSAYALARGGAAVVLGGMVGGWVDEGGRLGVVRGSIVLQRVMVAASCVLFGVLESEWIGGRKVAWGILGVLIALACVEKLASVTNTVAVERDWVVAIANGDETYLQAMNSQMRRIDLICKLCGPFFISIIDGFSTEMAIAVNLGFNLISVPVEYFAIERVYKKVPTLQKPEASPARHSTQPHEGSRSGTVRKITHALLSYTRDLTMYTNHRAFLPSFAGATLYFTVLSFGGQMVTYLLSAGYSSVQVAVVRTVSVAVEVSATWLAPWAMRRVGPVRAGIWFLNWQVACLTAVTTLFWTVREPTVAASWLVTGTILSRVGLWGYDLSAQIIVQEEVESARRGTFSAVEASWQNAFELCSFAATVAFARPEEFRWPVLASCGATAVAAGLYAAFVRRRRGHLLHLSECMELKRKERVRGSDEMEEEALVV